MRAKDGSSTMAVLPIALPRDASVVFTCVAAAETSMVVTVAPIFSKDIGTVAGWLTNSSTLSITTSAKPDALAVSL